MITMLDYFKAAITAFDGLLLIDKDLIVLYMDKTLAEECGYASPDECVGQSIRKIIPSNTSYKVIETGTKQIGELYFVDGSTVVSNSYPIFIEGKLEGVVEYDAFQNTTQLYAFLDNLVECSRGFESHRNMLHSSKSAKYLLEDIVGSSAAICEMKENIQFAARSSSTVLIEGATGSGKELVAHAIHNLSTRSFKNFVRINCAAIPESLFESELFGYEEGSFTGAKKGGRKGKTELANGGTLFLDEINQLPIVLQPKLLRFMQEKEVLRVGGDFGIQVDVRIIAASNQNLYELMKEKLFREDLYYRLNVINIDVPPLCERKEDIPQLAYGFLNRLNSSLERIVHKVSHIDNEVFDLLSIHNWPGNVRELQNTVEMAMNRCMGEVLHIEHFIDFQKKYLPNLDSKFEKNTTLTLEEIRQEAEKNAILQALCQCKNNKSKASEALGISRQMLHKKIIHYGLTEKEL